MPIVDGGVVLQAGVAANVGGFGDFLQQVAGVVLGNRAPVRDGVRCPFHAVFGGAHEFVGHAHAMVGVLKRDGVVSAARHIKAAVVTGFDERPCFLFFVRFASDELFDIGMIGIQESPFWLRGVWCRHF